MATALARPWRVNRSNGRCRPVLLVRGTPLLRPFSQKCFQKFQRCRSSPYQFIKDELHLAAEEVVMVYDNFSRYFEACRNLVRRSFLVGVSLFSSLVLVVVLGRDVSCRQRCIHCSPFVFVSWWFLRLSRLKVCEDHCGVKIFLFVSF